MLVREGILQGISSWNNPHMGDLPREEENPDEDEEH